MTALPSADLTDAEALTLARIEAEDDAPEALRERVTVALLRAILGNTDGELMSDGDLPASEIARLIHEDAADAALEVMRGER